MRVPTPQVLVAAGAGLVALGILGVMFFSLSGVHDYLWLVLSVPGLGAVATLIGASRWD